MFWVTGILGFVMLAAPFFAGYSYNQTALWTSLIAGAMVLVVSVLEGTAHGKDRWEYWTALTIGIAAVLAPFILGFTTLSSAMWTSIGVGVLIALFAGSRLIYGQPN